MNGFNQELGQMAFPAPIHISQHPMTNYLLNFTTVQPHKMLEDRKS